MISSFSPIGRNIRTLRKRNGLTQDKLAEKANISALQLGHIERGSRLPSLSHLYQIADALHVPVEDLFSSNLPKAYSGDTPAGFTPENVYRLIESSSSEARRLMYSVCWLIASDFKI